MGDLVEQSRRSIFGRESHGDSLMKFEEGIAAKENFQGHCVIGARHEKKN